MECFIIIEGTIPLIRSAVPGQAFLHAMASMNLLSAYRYYSFPAVFNKPFNAFFQGFGFGVGD